MKYILAALIVVLTSVLYCLCERLWHRRLRRAQDGLRSRRAYRPKEWCDVYYGGKTDAEKKCIVDLLVRFQVELRAPIFNATPSDTLDHITAMPFTERVFPDDIWGALEDLIPEYHLCANWRTLDDLITSVLKQADEKKRALVPADTGEQNR